jgi:hypothetical protein
VGAPFRLSQFSVFGRARPKGALMGALIKGWFDDSRRGTVWSVGGYIGGDHRWEAFDRMWPMALANHGVPYFHMKEMGDPNGVFSKFHPPQEHREELADFFGGLAKVIGQSRLVGISSIVRQPDLDRFNRDFGQALEAYPLAAYGCMLLAARENIEGISIELIFDNVEKVHSKLGKARDYADAEKIYEPGICDHTVTVPLSKGLTWREVPALQAADFFAWEFRKNHERVSEWFEIIDKPDDWEARADHLDKWLTEKFGDNTSSIRKSAAALLNGNEFYTLIWDYKNLVDSHKARGGVWA